jgi:predicted aldo/keto reductase-like oxidoreductase
MYLANPSRYDTMQYKRCGRSGLKLPAVSLGFWHNFGGVDRLENSRAIARCAFDLGITHFDLANNYGPPYGSAEETLAKVLKDLPLPDGLIHIEGRLGCGRSVRHLDLKYHCSLDQSLKHGANMWISSATCVPT